MAKLSQMIQGKREKKTIVTDPRKEKRKTIVTKAEYLLSCYFEYV